MKTLRAAAAFALLAASAALVAGEPPRPQVTVDRQQPALNETFQVRYTFVGVSGGVKPPMRLVLKNLTLMGGPATSTQIMFANGDLTRTISFTYYLRPQNVGPAEVTETEWVIGDSIVKAETVAVDVVAARAAAANPAPTEEEPDIFGFPSMLRPRVQRQPRREALVEYIATPDKSAAFVGEEVTVHYELITQADIEGLEYVEPPKFPGCWAEDLEKPERPTGRRDVYKGQNVTRFTLLKKAVAGLAPGTVTLPATKIRLAVRGASDPYSDPFAMFGRQVVARETQPIAIKVLPIPGAPDFKGPIGRFELSARTDRTRLAPGEALTLKVRLAGSGNLRASAAEPPEISIPNARVYPPTTKTDPGRGGRGAASAEWEYVIVPSSPGELTIPAATLAVFDPAEKRVLKKATRPIVVKVEGAAGEEAGTALASLEKGGGSGDAVTVEPAATPQAPASAAVTEAPAQSASLDLSRRTVTLPLWALAAIPGALLAVGAVVFAASRRQRTAPELRQAIAPEPGETKERAAARIDRAVRRWLAARHQILDGLPAAAVEQALGDRGVHENLRREVRILIEETDFLRFAPQLGDYSDKIREVRDRARRLVGQLK